MIYNSMYFNSNLSLLREIIGNRIINNILVNQIGLYNTNYIYNSNFTLKKPKLKRESSCQLYMQSLLLDTHENLNKRWLSERIIRAKKKQKYIDDSYKLNNLYKRYNNGDGFLLYDIIQSSQSQKEILFFRLKNSNKKYTRILKSTLMKNFTLLPDDCISHIILFLTYDIDNNNYI